MSYLQPIETIVGMVNTCYEDGILKSVQKIGFNVNKEELEKALRYDRGQYQKGYSDGKEETVDKMIEFIDRIEHDPGHTALIGKDNKFIGVLSNSMEFRDMVLALKGGEQE